MMLGKVAGGAVRLAEIGSDGMLGLCEGIETGLAVMTACPELPVWATLSTQHLEQVQLPTAARIVLILADHDASGAGLRSAEATAARLRAEGRHVVIVAPPEPGQDFNDLLLAAGPGRHPGRDQGGLATADSGSRARAAGHRSASADRLRPADCTTAGAACRRGRSRPRGRPCLAACCSPPTTSPGCSASPACPAGSSPTTTAGRWRRC